MIQHWNHWLDHALGLELLKSEKQFLTHLLEKLHGKHAVLIGLPKQYDLLRSTSLSFHYLVTPFIHHEKTENCIEGSWKELPISSGSVDLVIMPHTLEYVDNPHHVLSEACRIVKPEGSIVILNFNPLSLWGLQELFTQARKGNLLSKSTVKQWLTLADFELIKQDTFLFRPPLSKENLFEKMGVMEWIGTKSLLPLGGVYVLFAKAKVIPLSPIRLRWKQKELSGIRASIPGPSTRNTP